MDAFGLELVKAGLDGFSLTFRGAGWLEGGGLDGPVVILGLGEGICVHYGG